MRFGKPLKKSGLELAMVSNGSGNRVEKNAGKRRGKGKLRKVASTSYKMQFKDRGIALHDSFTRRHYYMRSWGYRVHDAELGYVWFNF